MLIDLFYTSMLDTTYSVSLCPQLAPQYILQTIQVFVLFFYLVCVILDINWGHQSVIVQDSPS